MEGPGALQRARADIETGRLWKARDRLQGYLRHAPADQRALHLLGDVCYRMGDLPLAGRYFYLTDRSGGDVDAAVGAFQEREGSKPVGLIHALGVHGPIEMFPTAVQLRLQGLRAAAKADGWDWQPPLKVRWAGGYRSHWYTSAGGWALGIFAVLSLLIGAVTIIRFVVGLF